MASRRPPSQRNAEFGSHRLARQTQSMIPGTAGGRLASASPVPFSSDSIASFAVDSVGTDTVKFARDRFPSTGTFTTAPTSVTLTYAALNESLLLMLNGHPLDEGNDYTIADAVVTILSAANVGSGDYLDAHYAYTSDGVSPPPYSSGTQTFAYNGIDGTNGSAQTFTVPADITSLQVECYGAQGGSSTATGGLGGYLKATVAVTPGQVLKVYVGGQGSGSTGGGGYNGGGAAGVGSGGGAGGGGASDIRSGAYALADRLVMAAGGGGAGSGSSGGGGGTGGGLTGGTGANGYAGATGGTGGTQTAGGAGGTGAYNGAAGTLGQGGAGGTTSGFAGQGSGGGGGGLYGGGGGAAEGGGGGGGSSSSSGTIVTNTSGSRSGHGQVVVTW